MVRFKHHAMRSPVEASLEGVGVAPVTEAPHTQEALLSGRDNALEAAVEWIASP